MPAVALTAQDVLTFNSKLDPAAVEILISDGLALAEMAAPCIVEDDFQYAGAAAAIIRSAVLRWAESGSGAVTSQSQTAGPYSKTTSFDTRQARRSLFFPSEITELQKLCKTNAQAAFAIDTLPGKDYRAGHAPYCSVMFATGTRCSCGAELTDGKGPLW